MIRKIISVIITFFVSFSMISFGVNAEDNKENEDTSEYAEIETESQTDNYTNSDEKNNSINEERTSEGKAYAILTEEGSLIFFRSYEDYENRANLTVKDVLGNQYSGTVYSDIETKDYGNNTAPWFERNIIKSFVADGQTIRPISTAKWFMYCYNLASVDLSGLDTSNVRNMNRMFAGCMNLKDLDVSHFNTSSVTDMESLFSNCSSLTSIDVSHFDTSSLVTAEEMFSNCSSLTSLDVSGFDTSKITSFANMFSNCSSLTSIDVSGFDTGNAIYLNSMFDSCSALTSLNVTGFDTSKAEYIGSMFGGCSGLTEIDVSHFKTGKVKSFDSMFNGCSGLTKIDVSNFDTSNATTMYSMFRGCSKIESLDLSNFDTSKVTWMQSMFNGCNQLKDLNISSFDTGKVTDMISMFESCWSLEKLDVSHFNTSSVRLTCMMFQSCSGLTELNLHNFDTSSVEETWGMFAGCRNLTRLDLGNFNTSNITDMRQMFDGCERLQELNIASFDTSKVNDMSSMFNELRNLGSVKLGEKFTVWCSNAYLPEGNWTNGAVSKSETELYNEYPANASAWAGTWTRYIPVTGLYLSSYDLSLFDGDQGTISVEYYPENATNKNVVWTTTDESVAVVDENGNVKAVGVGDATITASMENGKFSRSCKVSVFEKDDDLKGKAYAIITDDDEMIFFRSLEKYEDKSYGTVTDITGNMYSGTIFNNVELVNVPHSSWYSDSAPWQYPYSQTVKRIRVADGQIIRPRFTAIWFMDFKNLESIDLHNFDTCLVTDMGRMFDGCKNLTQLDLSGFDTSNVTDMNSLFSGCSKLRMINLSSFNTGKTNNMSYMFYSCNNLRRIVLGEGFTVWKNNAYLPSGTWTNGNLAKTEIELYNQYPGNAAGWSGTWARQLENDIVNINGSSLALEGKIGLNFFLDISEEEREYLDVHMKMNGKETVIPAVDGTSRIISNHEYMMYDYPVAAKEMRDTVTLTVEDKSGYNAKLIKDETDYTDGYQFSAADYFAKAEEAGMEKTKKLSRVINNYGKYAQIYFNYNVTDEVRNVTDVSNVTASTLEPYQAVMDSTELSGLTYVGGSAMLDDAIGYRLYFNLETGHEIDEYTFTIDGNKVTPVLRTGTQYYIEKANIAAKDLGVMNEIKVTDGTRAKTIRYSALSYAYTALGLTEEKRIPLQNMCRAMYLYNQQAIEYFVN